MTTDIAPVGQQAIQRGAAEHFPSSRYEGEEQEDSILPRVHLFQGLPKEKEIYGKGPASGGNWEEGDLIDSSAREKVPSRKFVPIFGFSEFIKFGMDAKGKPTGDVIYRHRDKSKVPAGDLEWKGEGEGRTPPACTKFMNFIVLFEGAEIPLAISFKTTSINAGKTLNALEKMRSAKGPGLYEFGFKRKTNARGSWLTPVIRPVGNPDPKLRQTVIDMYRAMGGGSVEIAMDAAIAAEDEGGAGSGDEGGNTEFDPASLK